MSNPIKPFTPGEIISKICEIIKKNKMAKTKLLELSNNMVFIAPELLSNRFWYGSNTCLGFTEILNKYCIKTDDPEIKEENKKIKKLYQEIINQYKDKGFDKSKNNN